MLLSGTVFTARDAAHKRMCDALSRGEELPFDVAGQIIYYAGPAPAQPGQIIGSCGPTTSCRMDAYTIPLLERGLRGMIGKGERGSYIYDAISKSGAVYFGAIGGAGALLSKCVTSCETVCYDDLGCESVKKLTIKDFPLIVIYSGV